MKIFTQKMTVTDSASVSIQRSDDGTSGCIPTDISPRAISVMPEDTTKEYYVIGNVLNCAECKQTGKFTIEGIPADSGNPIFYVKSASGTITINLYVKGF